jgi:hypothetical protein
MSQTQMSVTRDQDAAHIVLNEQLERDTTGELRDRLIGELRTAGADIEAALDRGVAPAEVETLRNLLEAVQLSECILDEVWHSVHG